jgi:hypothetical protein
MSGRPGKTTEKLSTEKCFKSKTINATAFLNAFFPAVGDSCLISYNFVTQVNETIASSCYSNKLMKFVATCYEQPVLVWLIKLTKTYRLPDVEP